jgi:hypothetical protein
MIEIAGVTAGAATGTPNAATNGAANGAARERVRAAADAPPAEAGPLQRTCLAVLRGAWTTLAIVSADALSPAQPLATGLADVARAYRLRPVRAVDGSTASPGQLAHLQDELAAARGAEGRLVVAVGDPRRNPGAVPLLVHAEAVVIVVRLGATELRAVEEIVGLVGRERVLGCVVAR